MTVFCTKISKASLLDISRLVLKKLRCLSLVFNGFLLKVNQNIKIISSKKLILTRWLMSAKFLWIHPKSESDHQKYLENHHVKLESEPTNGSSDIAPTIFLGSYFGKCLFMARCPHTQAHRSYVNK